MGRWFSFWFSFFGVLKYIVLPQAFRISVPALSNVAMDLVKGTSLAATITVPEIFQKAKIIGGRTFDYFSLYFSCTDLLGHLYRDRKSATVFRKTFYASVNLKNRNGASVAGTISIFVSCIFCLVF